MQAALYNQEPVELPAGGIATFLTAQTGSWADDDDYPTTGIGSIPDVADKLAEFGRYEDTYMVHAAEGETVIPMEVFDKNPALKDSLFAQMREMGIEPEEYIVGSELNSLNPVTGQPEFFLKKLFRGLKKAVKKVFKVVAPIVVQTLLTPILGPMGASAATSFLQAKISGASTKDAFKSAGIAALTTGITKGVQSKVQGGTFGEGVKSSVTGRTTFGDVVDAQGNPAYRPSEIAKLMGAQDTGTGYFQAGTPAAAIADSLTGQGAAQGVAQAGGAPVVDQSAPLGTTQAGTQASGATTYAGSSPPDLTATPLDKASIDAASQTARLNETALTGASNVTSDPGIYKPAFDTAFDATTPSATQTLADLQATAQTPSLSERFTNVVTDQGDGFLTDTKELFFPSKPTTEQVMRAELAKEGVNASGKSGLSLKRAFQEAGGTDAYLKEALKKYDVGMIDRYALPAALAVGANYAMTPEVEEGGVPADFDTRLGIDVFSNDPIRYGYGYNTYGGFRPAGMAHGGSFPPRDGAIAGPGTETSDDIPAMLSDGEFVMTAQAVRGAGDGSRKQGMRRMYDMMRNFESAA